MLLPLILVVALSQGQLAVRRSGNAAVPPIGKVRGSTLEGGAPCAPYPAITNYVTYSNTFSDASWLKLQSGSVAPVMTAAQAVAPDGTGTGWRAHFYATTGGGTYSFVVSLTGHTGLNTNTLWVRGTAFSLSGTIPMGYSSTVGQFVNCSYSYGYWSQCQQVGVTSTQDVSAFGNMNTTISMPEQEVYVWQYDATGYATVTPHITTTSTAVTRAAGCATETATTHAASGSIFIGDSIPHLGSPSMAVGLNTVYGLSVQDETVAGARFNDSAVIGPGTTPGCRQQFLLHPEFTYAGVVIFCGTNSLNGGSSAATLWNDYKGFLDQQMDAGTMPVAVTITDCSGYAGCIGAPQAEHASFNSSLRSYASGRAMRVVDCQTVTGDGGYLWPECDSGDGIHLSQLCIDRCRNLIYDAGVPQ